MVTRDKGGHECQSTRGERAGKAKRSVYAIFVPIGREVLEYTWKMQREEFGVHWEQGMEEPEYMYRWV